MSGERYPHPSTSIVKQIHQINPLRTTEPLARPLDGFNCSGPPSERSRACPADRHSKFWKKKEPNRGQHYTKWSKVWSRIYWGFPNELSRYLFCSFKSFLCNVDPEFLFLLPPPPEADPGGKKPLASNRHVWMLQFPHWKVIAYMRSDFFHLTTFENLFFIRLLFNSVREVSPD